MYNAPPWFVALLSIKLDPLIVVFDCVFIADPSFPLLPVKLQLLTSRLPLLPVAEITVPLLPVKLQSTTTPLLLTKEKTLLVLPINSQLLIL